MKGEVVFGLTKHGARLSGGGENFNRQVGADFSQRAYLPGSHWATSIELGRARRIAGLRLRLNVGTVSEGLNGLKTGSYPC